MPVSSDIRILFRAAAGPRRGFGHLVRCRSLARALGVRPLLSVRGTRPARDVALGLECDLVNGSARQLIRAIDPHVLVVDDPIGSRAKPWIDEGRRAGALVVTIHDLGIGCTSGDLVVDGSVAATALRARKHGAAGPGFAILDPSVAATERAPRRRGVLIALGGGPRAELARAIAIEIATLAPDVPVRIAGGFLSKRSDRKRRSGVPRNVLWLQPSKSLARELYRAEVAVVGGGVSLYEACAAGTAAVGVPVVEAQRPTVAGFVARGAALGRTDRKLAPRQIAVDAWRLLRNDHLRRRVSDAGRRLVDGRGASRVARAIQRRLRSGRHERMREAS